MPDRSDLARRTATLALSVLLAAPGCSLSFPTPGSELTTRVEEPACPAIDRVPLALHALHGGQIDTLLAPTLAGDSLIVALAIDDLDRDGLADVAVVRSSGLGASAILRGVQPCELLPSVVLPTMATPTAYTALVIEGDDEIPALVAHHGGRASVLALTTSAEPTADPALDWSAAALGGVGAAAGDVDRDGFLDVLIAPANSTRPVRLLEGGDGGRVRPIDNLDPALSRWWLADFDGDGRLDALGAPDFRTVSTLTPALVPILYLDPGAGLDAASPAPIDGLGEDATLAVADLDRDGDLDLIAVADDPERERAGVVRIAWNDGAGRFGEPELIPVTQLFSAEGLSRDIAIGDLDLDGLSDVLVADADGMNVGQLVVLRRTADARVFERLREDDLGLGPGELTTNSPPRVAIGDLDGDVDLDVVTTRVAVGPTGLVADSVALLRAERGADRTVRVEVRGSAGNVRAIGATICVAAPGALPGDGSCRGALLGHRALMATSAQHDPHLATFGTGDHEVVDVRVITPRRADFPIVVHDIPGVAARGTLVRVRIGE